MSKDFDMVFLICQNGVHTGASGKVCAKFMRNLSGRMLRFLDEQLQTEEFEEENVREAQIQILQIASLIK